MSTCSVKGSRLQSNQFSVFTMGTKNFLTSWMTISFSRRIVLYVVSYEAQYRKVKSNSVLEKFDLNIYTMVIPFQIPQDGMDVRWDLRFRRRWLRWLLSSEIWRRGEGYQRHYETWCLHLQGRRHLSTKPRWVIPQNTLILKALHHQIKQNKYWCFLECDAL
jgi:hypothetical protein